MWPVKLGLATAEWEKKASWGCCYLMIALVSVYPSTDVPFWYTETDHLISVLSTLSTSRTELSGHSPVNEKCIIIVVCIHNMTVSGWKNARMADKSFLQAHGDGNGWDDVLLCSFRSRNTFYSKSICYYKVLRDVTVYIYLFMVEKYLIHLNY